MATHNLKDSMLSNKVIRLKRDPQPIDFQFFPLKLSVNNHLKTLIFQYQSRRSPRNFRPSMSPHIPFPCAGACPRAARKGFMWIWFLTVALLLSKIWEAESIRCSFHYHTCRADLYEYVVLIGKFFMKLIQQENILLGEFFKAQVEDRNTVTELRSVRFSISGLSP